MVTLAMTLLATVLVMVDRGASSASRWDAAAAPTW